MFHNHITQLAIICFMYFNFQILRQSSGRQNISNNVLYKILTGKPTGKRPLGRPKRRWEGNIRIDLEEIGINAGNWVDSAQDRDYWRALVNARH